MHLFVRPGRIVFAIGILALGVLQFFTGDFIIGRPPSPSWPAGIPGKLLWAYVSGCFLIIAALAIVFNKKAGVAALATAIMIFVFSFLFRHLPEMMSASLQGALWSINAWKTLALAGGALIVAASFFKDGSEGLDGPLPRLLLISGIVSLAFFLVICGFSHYKFSAFVFMFIPDYIPQRTFWTYFTGTQLINGGVGLLFKPLRKWAAFLSGIMVLSWFVFLHIPRTLAAPHEYDEWKGLFESFTFSGILFVLAGLFAAAEMNRPKSSIAP